MFEALAAADASTGWTVMIGAGLMGRPRRAAPSDVRRALRRRTRRHRRRRHQPERLDRGRRRRVPGDRPVGLRQRLRARQLDLRRLHRGGRRRRSAAADRRVLARRGGDRGHLARVRALRAPGATTSTSTASSSPPTGPRRFTPSRASTRRSSASRRRRCSRASWRAWPSGPLRARSTTSSISPRTRCRCSPAHRSPPNPTFQLDLATADTELRAARSLLYEAAASLWAMAVDGDEPTLEERARVRAAAAWATERAGGRRRHRVPRRRWRLAVPRLPAAAPPPRHPRRHPALPRSRDTMTTAGAILAGNDVDLLLF